MGDEVDFSRCRDVWVPDDSDAGGFWSPPPPHVRHGVEQIMAHPFFLLADDMGGMKTAQALIAAQFLHDAGAIDRVIVVAPASLRTPVWFDQDLGQIREQAFADKRVLVSEYHSKVRQWAHGPADAKELRIIVTNYEFIRDKKNLAILLPYCGPRTMLVFDESNAVRTADSAQTRAAMLLRWRANVRGNPVLGTARCGRVLEMNGTPVAESPLDMFSQGNLLDPSILECRYITHFKARYAVQVPVIGPNGKKILSPYTKTERQPDGTVKRVPQYLTEVAEWANLEDLTARFAPYVLRREAKDLGIDFALPPVGIEVPLGAETWRAYRSMRDELVVWFEGDGRVANAKTAAIKVMRLAQITSGFLGGVEDSGIEEFADLSEFVTPPTSDTELDPSLGLVKQGAFSFTMHWPGLAEDIMVTNNVFKDPQAFVPRPSVQEISREKLDAALDWHEGLLRRDSDLKLLVWCRFVPELRRYLAEVKRRFPHVAIGAACGQPVLGESVKKERAHALALLHPKTAPEGPVVVGATQGTGALGLNFTACRTVLDMSYDFSPWKKKQGDSRVNRPGQTGPVSFHYLIAVGPKGQKTVDHHIMLTRLGKMQINDLTTSGWVQLLREE